MKHEISGGALVSDKAIFGIEMMHFGTRDLADLVGPMDSVRLSRQSIGVSFDSSVLVDGLKEVVRGA